MKSQIQRRKESATAFAHRVGTSRSAVQKWFTQPVLMMRPDIAWAIADALKMGTSAAVREQLKSGNVEPRTPWEILQFSLESKEINDGYERLMERAGKRYSWPWESRDDENENNVAAESGRRFYDIPMFDLPLGMGPWMDVQDIPDICGPDSIKQGLFRTRVSGDSMLPKYQSGMVVEFECVSFATIGKDHYVQKDDGTATLKQVEKATEQELVLRALNRKKYPNPIIVKSSTIVRMAIVKGIFIPMD